MADSNNESRLARTRELIAALPKTCENFTKLCTSGSVVDAADRSAENWGYKGTNVHKIEKVRKHGSMPYHDVFFCVRTS